MSAYVLYSCGCSLDVSAPCRLTQLLTARNCPHSCPQSCSLHATAHPCTCSTDATAHATAHATARCTQLITQLLTSGTCSVDATAHAPAPWMRRHKHLLRGCDGALHASGGLRGVDRGLPSVRSARGLQGRQELELLTPGARRILVCRLCLRALGQLLRETSKRG